MQNGGGIDPRMLLQNQVQMNHAKNHVESVDELIRKLEGQGKKIKILDDDENETKQSPTKASKKKKKPTNSN